ncbi:hypothetical protein EG19_12175 [Thermoanaerobaculum aquaticum]|uniref:Uncharacterized protein n=1 Tax=Thermoanaerobaculum aquaticum TaxID=1312852 RepID=A0A062Y133_9BACT|nr:hypothetical protein [Thermoanaerobaculum aquaticum]KDA54465.1 hypothetical protein EG19_12175 [Thermoanaerobaculum aquaticum]
MLAATLLATAFAGVIPVPDSVKRFPDASYWPGVGAQRDGNMLAAIRKEAGEELLTRGPGPSQILARFEKGALTPDQRVSVLLSACYYHDPQLLPLYLWAFEKGNVKDKLAAVVGFYQLIGLLPPAPSAVPATGPHWQQLAARTKELMAATREQPLVALWVNSYLEASGLPHRSGFTFKAKPEECLEAVARLAQPEDLSYLVALWPLTTRFEHRSKLVRVFEAITLSQVVPVVQGERAPTGPWIMETAINSVDAFVSNLCRTPDGWGLFLHNAASLANGDLRTGLLKVLRQSYAPVWPLAAAQLQGYGAPAAIFNRTWPDHPDNKAARERVLEVFRDKRR